MLKTTDYRRPTTSRTTFGRTIDHTAANGQLRKARRSKPDAHYKILEIVCNFVFESHFPPNNEADHVDYGSRM